MRRFRKDNYGAISEINIANLVDVVLVLLIIFMISAPLLQSGIEVDLPKTRAAAIDQPAEGAVITIDNKGGIYINDVWARLDNFEDALHTQMQAKNTNNVYIRGDSAVSYGIAIQVVAKLKEMGIDGIGLVTAPVESKSRK